MQELENRIKQAFIQENHLPDNIHSEIYLYKLGQPENYNYALYEIAYTDLDKYYLVDTDKTETTLIPWNEEKERVIRAIDPEIVKQLNELFNKRKR